jgi:hypothetical protein
MELILVFSSSIDDGGVGLITGGFDGRGRFGGGGVPLTTAAIVSEIAKNN